jgi:enamine deaminase RidA (YjgF/YER057c/UK114 family)
MHKLYSSGSSWETKIGYSRAVAVGNTLYVSATAATGADGKIVGEDIYTQTRHILKKIEGVLKEAGFEFTDVVQSRLYLTDNKQWEDAGRAHGEVFGSIRPALTLLHVLPFVDPAMLVEIEITAVKSGSAA